MKFRLFGITDVGRARDHNEDNFVICKDLSEDAWTFDRNEILELSDKGTILVVADGMGGTNAGEIASDLAQNSIREQFEQLDEIPDKDDAIIQLLNSFILNAHKQIVQYQQENLDTAGMGTTLVITWILNDTLYTSWSGDSRCYVFNPHSALYPLTEDHSHVWEMVKSNHLTPEQARTHPESNLITQNLGDPNQKPNPEGKIRKLNPGERVLVCSDGLNGMISDAAIHYILVDEKSTAAACKKLVEEAKQAGGHDNITVLLLDVEPGEESMAAPAALHSTKGEGPESNQQKSSHFTSLLGVLLILAVGAAFYFWSDSDSSGSNDLQKSAIFSLDANTITVNGNQPTEISPVSMILPYGPKIDKLVLLEPPKYGKAEIMGDKIVYTADIQSGPIRDRLKVEMHGPSNSIFTAVFQLTGNSTEGSGAPSEIPERDDQPQKPDSNQTGADTDADMEKNTDEEEDIGQQSTPVPDSTDTNAGSKESDDLKENQTDSTDGDSKNDSSDVDTIKSSVNPDTTTSNQMY